MAKSCQAPSILHTARLFRRYLVLIRRFRDSSRSAGISIKAKDESAEKAAVVSGVCTIRFDWTTIRKAEYEFQCSNFPPTRALDASLPAANYVRLWMA